MIIEILFKLIFWTCPIPGAPGLSLISNPPWYDAKTSPNPVLHSISTSCANIDLVKLLCKQMDEKLRRSSGSSSDLITYVKDRPGHDLRYAIDASKIQKELDWEPSVTFEEGLSFTIDWYLDNVEWLNNVTSGSYKEYYNKQYS